MTSFDRFVPWRLPRPAAALQWLEVLGVVLGEEDDATAACSGSGTGGCTVAEASHDLVVCMLVSPGDSG